MLLSHRRYDWWKDQGLLGKARVKLVIYLGKLSKDPTLNFMSYVRLLL